MDSVLQHMKLRFTRLRAQAPGHKGKAEPHWNLTGPVTAYHFSPDRGLRQGPYTQAKVFCVWGLA